MEQCLAETGISIWLVVIIAIIAIAVGAALLYKPLRQKLGLLAILFALASTFTYATPALAATADCRKETSQAPANTPSTPTNPVTPTCVVSRTESCSDPQLRSDEQGRLVACNADSTNEVDQWTSQVWRGSIPPENIDIDQNTDGVQHTLDRPDRGFRAIYNPENDELAVTITDASLYPAPPTTCGPCEESRAPELLVVSWRFEDRGTSYSGGYSLLSDGCNAGGTSGSGGA